jgi:hypothetical protein
MQPVHFGLSGYGSSVNTSFANSSSAYASSENISSRYAHDVVQLFLLAIEQWMRQRQCNLRRDVIGEATRVKRGE